MCSALFRMAACARDSAAAAATAAAAAAAAAIAAAAAANKTTALHAYIKDSTVVIITTVGVKYL